jgi:hypothetical protein
MSASAELDRLIDEYTPDVARLARAALARLRTELPGAIELIGDDYNGLVIGFSPTERAWDAVVGLVLYPRWVNLFFIRGATLRDPSKVLRGSGKIVRHIVLKDPKTLEDPAVRDLLKQARAQATAPFPKRRRTIIKRVAAKRRARRPIGQRRSIRSPILTGG